MRFVSSAICTWGAGVAGSPPVVVENLALASFVRVTTDVG